MAMRRKQERIAFIAQDDADMAAGLGNLPSPPVSRGGMSVTTSTSDIEFFEDLVSEPVLVLGMDISHLSRNGQFTACACGVFFFSLLYGFLQELLSVQLCSRKLGLFLATVQFVGYTFLAFLLRTYVYQSQKRKKLTPKLSNISLSSASSLSKIPVPFKLYLGLSLLRALDLGMTNLAMQYINYPAKTLMKSSRVVFTMLFGVLITKKVYKCIDYFVVMCMVAGLAIFLHADANSSAVFQPLGVVMLVRICTVRWNSSFLDHKEILINKYGSPGFASLVLQTDRLFNLRWSHYQHVGVHHESIWCRTRRIYIPDVFHCAYSYQWSCGGKWGSKRGPNLYVATRNLCRTTIQRPPRGTNLECAWKIRCDDSVL
jgi:hypothetical protein